MVTCNRRQFVTTSLRLAQSRELDGDIFFGSPYFSVAFANFVCSSLCRHRVVPSRSPFRRATASVRLADHGAHRRAIGAVCGLRKDVSEGVLGTAFRYHCRDWKGRSGSV